MARLNEPPPPALESIDALKRRFLRQNREIARSNSTQSVRIQNLNCEVSRLLGENASLREQVIQLQYESEKSATKVVVENVDIVKSRLEAKLLELGGLVQDLGCMQKTVEGQRTQKRKSINSSSQKRSPDQRIWKNTLTLSEAVGGTDGRLPPIMEDKYYPRQTMSADELLGLTANPANLTDSPDLGPPPIAHFEEGDPIKFDPSQEQPFHSRLAAEQETTVLSANLETRRKRRESSHHGDPGGNKASTEVMKTVSSVGSGIDHPLKSGAKRKFNVREEDDPSEGIDVLEKEDFQYSRRTSDIRRLDTATSKPITSKAPKPSESMTSLIEHSGRQHRREKSGDIPVANVTITRKALGPKSVNTDPTNSPLKNNNKSSSKDKATDAKDDSSRIVRDRNRSKARIHPRSTGLTKERYATANTIAEIARTVVENPAPPPPETPAPPPNDLLSPTSTEPSAPRADSRDTPPPPDLGLDTGTGSFGRGSRRPRGAVNYAQPNLRDKMRRPTAELVDAVAAEERARQARTAIAEREKSDSVAIKQEDSADGLPVWKTNDPNDGKQRVEPTSPLCNKTGITSNDLPSSIITERRRRTIVSSRRNEVDKPNRAPSAAASTIAALAAGSNRPNADKAKAVKDGDGIAHESAERASIYDFTGSSPSIGENAEDPGSNDEETRPSRSSRRHSGVPASLEQLRKPHAISRRGERRRESVLDARQDESVGKGVAQPIARTRSVLDLGADDGEVGMGRNERAASRRRSMML